MILSRLETRSDDNIKYLKSRYTDYLMHVEDIKTTLGQSIAILDGSKSTAELLQDLENTILQFQLKRIDKNAADS